MGTRIILSNIGEMGLRHENATASGYVHNMRVALT